MDNFLIFIAPFIILILSIVAAFIAAFQDKSITKDK